MADQTQVKTGAYPDKTPDGRDIVYVAAPSVESTEAWAESQAAEREARRHDVAVGARIQALAVARDLIAYARVTGDENDLSTVEQRAERIVEVARVFDQYLLGTP